MRRRPVVFVDRTRICLILFGGSVGPLLKRIMDHLH